MKKIIVLALLLVGITVVAQERNRKHQGNKMEQFTPEQQSQLMLKKMTLELDLSDAQQKEMSAFISEKIAKKEAHKAEMKAMKEKGVAPTSDERFSMATKMLDEQIASKKSMQKILNAKQFEKWDSSKNKLKRKQQYGHQGKSKGKPNGPQGNPERKG